VGEARDRLAPRHLGTGPAAAAGLLVPLLALPWPLPPVPGAIDRASAAGPVALTVAAALVGLGLGLPWLVGALVLERTTSRRTGDAETEAAGVHPGLERDLDHHRPLSDRTLQGLGFLAVLSVFWLLFLLSGTLRTEYLAFVELALLTVALLAWLARQSRHPVAQTVYTVLLLALVIATVWLADRGRAGGSVGEGAPWDNPRAETTQEDLPWHDRHDPDTLSTRSIRSWPPSRS
jgi:hypothetical protein